MRYFLDTEFTNLPWMADSELLWVAIVDESGHGQFSAVNSNCSLDSCSPFVREHVLPKLDLAHKRLPPARLAEEIAEFVTPHPEFWAWFPSIADVAALASPGPAAQFHHRFADWDYQLLRNLFSKPPGDWPIKCRDLHALADATGVVLPPNSDPHDPLSDALWGRALWHSVQQVRSRRGRSG